MHLLFWANHAGAVDTLRRISLEGEAYVTWILRLLSKTMVREAGESRTSYLRRNAQVCSTFVLWSETLLWQSRGLSQLKAVCDSLADSVQQLHVCCVRVNFTQQALYVSLHWYKECSRQCMGDGGDGAVYIVYSPALIAQGVQILGPWVLL